MVGGLSEPLAVFWTGRGIHFMVLVSFTVQVMLLLLADIRRHKDWLLLKLVIWSAYMLADTAAIYALGHMSVLCNWSPEHQLMALWAPMLLVHLGGQDNISAYAIEDNRLWLRHLQTFVLQVAAAGYVLYVSSILSHPMSSKVRWAAILMFVVGVLKYGERIWALKCSNNCASSNLSATSYDKLSESRTAGDKSLSDLLRTRNSRLLRIVAYSFLDVPKQMFEGPTIYVQFSNNVDNKVQLAVKKNNKVQLSRGEHMLHVVKMQLSMMYDLLYTKAAVVHTWYGLSSRVLILLPFTIASLALFRSSSLAAYKRADVAVTNVLLIGAVILEIISVLRAIFSEWTAVLLYGYGWNAICGLVFTVTLAIDRLLSHARHISLQAHHMICTKSERYPMMRRFSWIGRMGQHDLFVLMGHHYNYSVGRKMAKSMRVEDWWDSSVYSWSSVVPERAMHKVVDLSTTDHNITKSQGLNAVRRHLNDQRLANWIWTEEELKLEERILVWHIATHVYSEYISWDLGNVHMEAAGPLANYMFFLLAARPYMLPYPVSRQVYLQLCHDVVTHFPRDFNIKTLVKAILNQKEALVNGTPLQADNYYTRQKIREEDRAHQPHQRRSMNTTTTLDRACQLAAKLIHITATVDGNEDIITGQTPETFTFSVNNGFIGGGELIMVSVVLNKIQYEVVLKMLLEVWVEMLCYTAYLCNEKSHAKHLTDGGGEFMTIITLFMIYAQNGFIG